MKTWDFARAPRPARGGVAGSPVSGCPSLRAPQPPTSPRRAPEVRTSGASLNVPGLGQQNTILDGHEKPQAKEKQERDEGFRARPGSGSEDPCLKTAHSWPTACFQPGFASRCRPSVGGGAWSPESFLRRSPAQPKARKFTAAREDVRKPSRSSSCSCGLPSLAVLLRLKKTCLSCRRKRERASTVSSPRLLAGLSFSHLLPQNTQVYLR